MTAPTTCPHCNANLVGEPIPPDARHLYPPSVSHYPRQIPLYGWGRWGHSIIGLQCPDCKRRID